MDNSIYVLLYDPAWTDQFQQIGAKLRHALGDVALRIDHIGSTSIPNLPAKPVIDIQISVQSFEPLNAFRLPLEELGYIWMYNNLNLMRRFFRNENPRNTHIHVQVHGTWSEQFTLIFRDYMRSHPQDAQRYAGLKYRLASQYANERERYTSEKTPFIWEIMQKADAWAQSIGWKVGKSDI